MKNLFHALATKGYSEHKGRALPLRIATVDLFDIADLKASLTPHGVRIGVASSVRKADWEPNEIYPGVRSPHLVVTDTQRELLRLFESGQATMM